MPKTDDEWKEKLSEEEYRVLRMKGTEAPFTGKFWNATEKGKFQCAACGNQLFSSDSKFITQAAGLQGWPSFDEALPGAVIFEKDASLGMNRTEVLCAQCRSHLGHVFDDDSEGKTGKHYCINSVCLDLKKEEEK